MAANERFKRLYSLPEKLYREGCPVLVDAGALLLDQQTGKTLVQLRLRNVSQTVLTGVKLAVECLDMEEILLGTAECSYPDLTLKPGEATGDRIPVYLSHANARSLRLYVTTVVDAGHNVWKPESKEPFQPLPADAPHTLSGELRGEYRQELKEAGYEKSGACLPQQAQGLWQCGCGGWNPQGAERCLRCGLGLAWQQEHMEPEGLAQRLEVRRQQQAEKAQRDAEAARRKAEEDARKVEEKRIAAEAEEAKRRAKNKQNGIIAGVVAAVVAVILLITQVIIPNNIRAEGKKLVENGQYAQAKETYHQLPDGYDEYYKAVRKHGVSLQLQGRYDDAVEAYDAIGRSTDVLAVKRIQISTHRKAGEYQAAMDVYATMNMSDVVSKNVTVRDEQNELILEWAGVLAADGDYDGALDKLALWSSDDTMLPDYEAYKAAKKAVYTAQGDALLAEGSYMAAADTYLLADDEDRAVYAQGCAYEHAGRYGLAAVEFAKCRANTALDAQQRYDSCMALSLVNPQVGDVVFIGKVRGVGGAPYQWRVLAVEGDQVLVQCLSWFRHAALMDGYGDKMDWVESPIRALLNSSDIYDCFTPEEQALIRYSSLQNDSGVTTSDRLFLLSKREVETYLPTEEARKAIGTDWWTRSFAGSDDAWRISYGEFDETFTNWEGYVYPAMRVLYLQSGDETVADAAARVMKPGYDLGLQQMQEGDYAAAIETLTAVSTYQDAQQQIYACYELQGDSYLEAGDYAQAAAAYGQGYAVKKQNYALGREKLQAGDYFNAAVLFAWADNVLDAPEQLYACQLKQLTGAKPGDVICLGATDVPVQINQKTKDGVPVVAVTFENSVTETTYTWYLEESLFEKDGQPDLSYRNVLAVMEDRLPGELPAKVLLEWRVVAVSGNKALLIAQSPVAYRSFHDTWEPVTWKDCTLRAYLNGEFHVSVFTQQELELLMPNQTAPDVVDLIFLPARLRIGEEDVEAALMQESGELTDAQTVFRNDALLLDAIRQLDLKGWERMLTLTPGDTGDYVQTLWLSSVGSRYSQPEYLPLYVNEPCPVYPMLQIRIDKEAEYAEAARLEREYEAALAQLESGDYTAAEAAFLALGNYNNSAEMAADAAEQGKKAAYTAAIDLLDNGDFAAAEAAFLALGAYSDSAMMAENAAEQGNAAAYAAALDLLDNGDFAAAEAAFLALGDYSDSAEMAAVAAEDKNSAAYTAAAALLEAGDYAAAEAAFLALGDYSNSAEMAAQAHDIPLRSAYDAAQAQLESGDYAAAEAAFLALDGYDDSAAKAQQAHDVPLKAAYDGAEALVAACDYAGAAQQYLAAAEYADAAQKAAYLTAELDKRTANEAIYREALTFVETEDYAKAAERFLLLGDYSNSAQQYACALLNAGQFDWLSAPLNDAYLFVKDGRTGYLNTRTGLVRTGDLGDPIMQEWHESGRALIREQNDYGILGSDGQILSPIQWTQVDLETDGMAVVHSLDRLGVLAADGSVFIPVENSAVRRVSDTVWQTNNALWVDGQIKWNRSNSAQILPPVSPQGSFVWACDDGKWRVLDTLGQELYVSDVPLGKYSYGSTVVYQDVESEKWGMLDYTTGKTLLKPTYSKLDSAVFNNDGSMVHSYQDAKGNWKHVMLDQQGKKVASFDNSPQPHYDFYRLSTDKGYYDYINYKGKTVASGKTYGSIYPMDCGVIAAEAQIKSSKQISGKLNMVYLLDKEGKKIFEREANWIAPLAGLPNVCRVIDGSQNLVIIDSTNNAHVVNLYERGLTGITVQPLKVDYLPGEYLLVAIHDPDGIKEGSRHTHRIISLDTYSEQGEKWVAYNILSVGKNGFAAEKTAAKWQPVRFTGTGFEPFAAVCGAQPVSDDPILFPETFE